MLIFWINFTLEIYHHVKMSLYFDSEVFYEKEGTWCIRVLSHSFPLRNKILEPKLAMRFSRRWMKVKVTLSLRLTKHHAMKTWGSGGKAPHILDLDTRWRWVVSFTPRSLYPQEKSPRYPFDRRLGGTQSRYGRGGEEKHSQPPPGIEP
jgi:hypothetical protein